jgi:hypothetical protein
MEDTTPTFDEFRRRIPITELALSQGYALNRAKGLKWPVLDHPDGDRVIIVNPGAAGGEGYFNPRDDRDRGNLVHFVMNRLGSVFPVDASLSKAQNVNRILCDWLRVPYSQRLSFRKAALPSRHGGKVDGFRFSPSVLLPLADTRYLESRSLLPATIGDPLFRGRILSLRGSGDGAVAFPYREAVDGPVVGAEVRSAALKRHLPGTSKSTSVWTSNPPSVTGRVVVCESAIDCLSYHQLRGGPGNLYISFGGTLTNGQMECVARMSASLALSSGFGFIIAVDNDEAGASYSKKLAAFLPDARVDIPAVGKDFNEMLMARRREVTR